MGSSWYWRILRTISGKSVGVGSNSVTPLGPDGLQPGKRHGHADPAEEQVRGLDQNWAGGDQGLAIASKEGTAGRVILVIPVRQADPGAGVDDDQGSFPHLGEKSSRVL